MLRSKSSGFSYVIGVIIVVALALITMTVFQFSRPKPPIEVIFSLEPSTIKENERSKLIFTFNNLDLRTHEINIVFETSPRISVYEGNEHLLQQNAYTFVIDASDPSEQRVFTIGGNLEAGILNSQFPITFSVYLDGNELGENWNHHVLTIQKP